MKTVEMTIWEARLNRSQEPARTFVLTLERLEYLIERGLITRDSIETDSLVPDLVSLVDRLSREKDKFERLELLGFTRGGLFVIEGVKLQARKPFQDRLYEFFREILSGKHPSEFSLQNNSLSVRWA